MSEPMIRPEWYILIGSALVHAIGLAWIARHDAAKMLEAWRRRRITPSDLDHAMHTVWLEGNWQWITRKMTSEEREAAIAAVLRYSNTALRDGDDDLLTRASLAWWEN